MRKNEKKNEHSFNVITRPIYKPSGGRKFTLDSMTTPDDSLTIRQLLINHTRGLGNVPTKDGIYTGDEVAPRYTDLNDRKNAVDELRRRIDLAKEQIEREKRLNQAQGSLDPGSNEVAQEATTQDA